MSTIDATELRQKYLAERDKRLRPDGNEQYVELTGEFAKYLDDPYVPPVTREPLTDEVTFAFIGGGFSGLLAGAKLKQAGIDDVLSYLHYPPPPRTRVSSTNPLERLNKEIRRWTQTHLQRRLHCWHCHQR